MYFISERSFGDFNNKLPQISRILTGKAIIFTILYRTQNFLYNKNLK